VFGWWGLTIEGVGAETTLPTDMERAIDSFLEDKSFHSDFQLLELVRCLKEAIDTAGELGNEGAKEVRKTAKPSLRGG